MPEEAGGGLHVGMEWYYAIADERLGPVTHEEFERLVRAGTVTEDALVWRKGMDQWKTLGAVRERDPALFSEMPPPLPAGTAAEETEVVRAERGVAGGSGESVFRRAPSLRVDAKEAAPEVLIYAGFWRRCGAFLVDGMLWFLVWLILINVVAHQFFPEIVKLNEELAAAGGGFGYQPKPEEVGPMLRYSAVVMIVSLVWMVAYDLLFVPRFGATPGKLLFGMQVVRANGERLGLGRVMARCLARMLAGFTLGIGYVIAGIDDEKRALHDYFCDTRVVKKR